MSQATTTTDVIVIGGGPIGIEMTIALKRLGVATILIEAKQIGDAFMQWPPNTQFFSTPEHVALAGVPVHNLTQQAITGEQYLAYLRTLVEMFDLDLRNYEPVSAVTRTDHNDFLVTTQPHTGQRTYRARHVILATGGMAGPRRLNIPGENLPHVSTSLGDPHRFFKTRVLIVGGRNSAVEAALRCWRVGASEVMMSYRRSEFMMERIKPHLSVDLGDRLEKGEISFYPATVPVEITPSHVVLASTEDGNSPNGRVQTVAADFVLLAVGFLADMRLFEMAGIALEGPGQVPHFNPATMETNVPGLFVAGTAAGGTQERFKLFISTSHDHVAKIARAITGKLPDKLGTIPGRNNAVSWEEVQAN